MSTTEEVVYLPCDIESINADDKYILVSMDTRAHPLSIWVPRDKIFIDRQPAPLHRCDPLKGWVEGRVFGYFAEGAVVEFEDHLGGKQQGVFSTATVKHDIGLRQATVNGR